MFHYDHFHVDLARHNGGRHICRPVIKFTPRRDLQPPDPARSWTALNEERQAPFRPAAPRPAMAQGPAPRGSVIPSTEPAVGGPIRLPGYVQGAEEVVIGDVEGEMIDPDNDPFALEDGNRRPPRPAAGQSVPAPQGSYTPRPAPPMGGERAAPSREWPPRF